MANLIRNEPGSPLALKQRIEANRDLAKSLLPQLPTWIRTRTIPELPSFLDASVPQKLRLRKLELWIRFLFSALTDADYLDTEAALDPTRSATRRPWPTADSLVPAIEKAISIKSEGTQCSGVNDARQFVAQACLDSAAKPMGIFSLTAPTGSGKTLAAMRFALHHARLHGLRRVIVVLPYTSIIEQNAAVYREVFGNDAVLEHHSNLDPEVEVEHSGEEVTAQHRLASENWDAPIIVTTTVQFFESLFANRSSRCRKLHNIVRSVVILDEVQSLPPGYLITILDALTSLSSEYGCSIVLSTATPPSLLARPSFPQGLPGAAEIIPEPAKLGRALRRVVYYWPSNQEPTTWEELASQILEFPQALAVVHLRNDARTLSEMLQARDPVTPVFHLSASMCPAHRSETIAEIRSALAAGAPCRLVSTQLIEAGVDIDFPVLFRAFAGLDSIVQAAGRCNREGRLPVGHVHIFNAPTQPPPGVLRQGIETMRALYGARGRSIDVSDPETCSEYFRAFYSVTVADPHGIQAEREEFNYFSVATKFRLIDDQCTSTIVVPYAEVVEEVIGRIERKGPTRDTFRALQPYTVRIYPRALAALLDAGAVEELAPRVYAISQPFRHLYDKTFGLVLKDTIMADASSLII
jgi:CRISPR-associated endonuclease/helicase Cas3